MSVLLAAVRAAYPTVEILPIARRFLVKAELTPAGCWFWTRSTSDQGYARFSVNAYPEYGHIWAYRYFIGPIPAGHQLDHLCHTNDQACDGGGTCPHRRCVNPGHLEPVTSQVNVERSVRVVRARAATHCVNDHLWTEANTYTRQDGTRFCRTCHRERVARAKHSTRAA
jgi:hypothetical protein